MGLTAIGTQMWAASGLLSFIGKAPVATRVLEALPLRLKNIGVGAVVGGATEAARPDSFIPEQGEASAWDVPAWIGQHTGLSDRAGLAVGGAVFGGAIGEVLGGVMAGMKKARTLGVALTMDQAQITAMRDALRSSGIEIEEGADRFTVASKFVQNMRKVTLNEATAGIISERLAREDYILSGLIGSANSAQAGTGAAVNATTEETGRLVAGIFRTNPGGVSVVTNVSDPSLVSIRMPNPKRVGDVHPFPFTGNKVEVLGGQLKVDEGFLNRPKDMNLVQDILDATDANGQSVLPGRYQLDLMEAVWKPEVTNADVMKYLDDYIAHNTSQVDDIARIKKIIQKHAKAPKFDPMAGMPEVSEWHVPQQRSTLIGGQFGTRQTTGKMIVTRNTRARFGGEGPWRVTTFDDIGDVDPAGHTWFNTQSEAEDWIRRQGGTMTPRSEQMRQISQTGLVFDAEKKLGMKLDIHVVRRGGYPDPDKFDILVARPVYEFPLANTLGKLNTKVNASLKALARETAQSVRAPKTTEALILSDGTPIRGGLRTADLEKKLHLQSPLVEGVPRADLALRTAAQPVRMDLVGTKELVIELPNKLTQEQFNSIGRSLDAVKMDKVTIKFGDQSTELVQPLGGQVQDAITAFVKPKSVKSALTPEIRAQFEKTRLIRGQAAVLPDGTAATVIGSGGGRPNARLIRVVDSLTGTEHVIPEKNLTLLPTTLNSELQPSQMFTQYLSEAERTALAKMRFAVSKGWAKEITKARDLKEFGNSRGFLVTSLRGGKFELTKVNDGASGGSVTFPNLKSAVEFIRGDTSIVPDLTPPSIANALGENLNIGWIGGGGHPPLPNEMIPMDWDRMSEAIEKLSPTGGISLLDAAIRPTKALFEQIDRRYGLQFTKVFENVSSSMTGNQNFQTLWFNGKGGKLPDGILPLKKIRDLAGKDARVELITDFRESVKGSPESQAIWDSMNEGERKAATELGKWFDAAYTHFGVEAPFVENYMPHFREMAEQGNGVDLHTLWKLMGGDPLKPPKGMDWVNEMVREGTMDIYEKDPFKVAAMYLRGAGHTRFMKDAYNQAREVVQQVASKNKLLGGVMGHFLQAVRGTEFPEQRAVLGETFRRILSNLPGEKVEQSAAAADRLVDLLTGSVYAATMGFRPSLALRNASSALVMVWPLYGGNGRFNEALLRAMTLAGKDEAVAARAINHAQGARFSQSEVEEAIRELIPRKLQDINEVGMGLYDSADQFTRAVAYHAAKMRAEDAITAFSKKVTSTMPPAKLEAAKRQLLIDSRMFLQDEQIVNEFLRRVGTNPDLAAQFAGKQASDIANFLYGRGMQAQWMRSVGGRLFGQFGTWPMWYIDYIRRIVGRAGMQGFRAEGAKLFAKHVLVNVAILAAGKEVLDVDLNKWASYGSIFWSGGPGVQIAAGASTLMRGLGSVTSGNEDPLAQSRISEGLATIWQTVPTYVPFYFGARDAIRLVESENPTEFLAAALGTQPTRQFTFEDRMNRILGVRNENEPFTASSPALEDLLNAKAAGKPVVDIRGLGARMMPPTPQVGALQVGGQSSSRSASVSMPANTPPDIRANLMNEVKKSAESKPIGNF